MTHSLLLRDGLIADLEALRLERAASTVPSIQIPLIEGKGKANEDEEARKYEEMRRRERENEVEEREREVMRREKWVVEEMR